MNGDTLGGLAPPLTFTAGKPHPVDCWYYALLEGRQVLDAVRPQPDVPEGSFVGTAERELSGPSRVKATVPHVGRKPLMRHGRVGAASVGSLILKDES